MQANPCGVHALLLGPLALVLVGEVVAVVEVLVALPVLPAVPLEVLLPPVTVPRSTRR